MEAGFRVSISALIPQYPAPARAGSKPGCSPRGQNEHSVFCFVELSGLAAPTQTQSMIYSLGYQSPVETKTSSPRGVYSSEVSVVLLVTGPQTDKRATLGYRRCLAMEQDAIRRLLDQTSLALTKLAWIFDVQTCNIIQFPVSLPLSYIDMKMHHSCT